MSDIRNRLAECIRRLGDSGIGALMDRLLDEAAEEQLSVEYGSGRYEELEDMIYLLSEAKESYNDLAFWLGRLDSEVIG